MVMLNAQHATSEDDFAGRTHLDAGYYHVAVQNCQETQSKKKGTPGIEVEFQVICEGVGPDKKTPTVGQAGQTISAFFVAMGRDEKATGRCIKNLTRLALATGILRPGQAIEPDWSEAIGRELIIQVIDETAAKLDEYGQPVNGPDGKPVYEPTGYTKVDWFGFWSMGNAAVGFVPVDSTSPGMQAAGKASPPPAQQAAAPAAAPVAAAPAAAPAKSKFADLL